MRLECVSCGMGWDVAPKPDGTMPKTSRCPVALGGCGKTRWVPRSAAPSPLAPGAGWDPPSPPRQPRETAEECPRCSGPLIASPRRTVRVCGTCRGRVTPPGVAAPYARGTGVTRAAKSRRERDDDAKATVLLAGEFLRRIRALLDDPQIHPASADLLGWYEEEISDARKARDSGRLAELAAEFDTDKDAHAFRRRHWWQGDPAAVVSGDVLDGEAEDGEPAAPVALATPASIAAQQHRAQSPHMTWAGALSANGWRLDPAAGDGCQIVDTRGQICGTDTRRHIGNAWICGRHYEQLGAMTSRRPA